MLIAPYVSKLLPWAYAEGISPIRPLHFMVLLGAMNVYFALKKSPEFTKLILLFVALLMARALDTALLARYEFDDGNYSHASSMFANVFMLGVYACTCLLYTSDAADE